MSMGEIVYEIRDSVEVLVGAEGLEPAFGWPYRRILAEVKKKRPTESSLPLTRSKLATTIVQAYVDHYSDYDRAAGRSVDLAAMDLAKIDAVKQHFTPLVAALSALDRKGHNNVLLAHWYAQTYKADQFVDLMDLCFQIQELFDKGSAVSKAPKPVIGALQGCIMKSGCSGFAYQHSHGLSNLFPLGVRVGGLSEPGLRSRDTLVRVSSGARPVHSA